MGRKGVIVISDFIKKYGCYISFVGSVLKYEKVFIGMCLLLFLVLYKGYEAVKKKDMTGLVSSITSLSFTLYGMFVFLIA